MVLYICDFGLKIDRYCRKENQVLCVMQKMLTLQIEHARNNFSKFTEFNKLVGGQVTWSPVMEGVGEALRTSYVPSRQIVVAFSAWHS